MKKEQHQPAGAIALCSFGKDSVATILLAKQHNEPLDEAVYCEVMFDKDISGEVPEHRDFIYGKAIPRLESMGVKVTVLRSAQTYVGLFTGLITRGPKKGKVRSFPVCGRCAVQRDCKVRTLKQYQRTLPPGTLRYIGIARDEQERLLRLEAGKQISLLEKYNLKEQDAEQLCRKAGLLSPVGNPSATQHSGCGWERSHSGMSELSRLRGSEGYGACGDDRGGCWFCPNAKRTELRHLYDYHQDLWGRMLALQAIPNKATEKFNRTQRFSDIDAIFRQEDENARLNAA